MLALILGRPMRVHVLAGVGFLFITCPMCASGQPSPARLNVALTASGTSHDSSRQLRLVLDVPSGWHIGAPPDSSRRTTGLPTHLEWLAPRGWRVSNVKWPIPARRIQSSDTSSVYTGRVAVEALLEARKGAHAGPVRVRIGYGLCRDVCIPGWATASLDP